MSALIMIDLELVHPVIANRWHRVASLHHLPQSGEAITTLCGQVEEAEYLATSRQTVIVETCWSCDLAYRRQHGIQVLPSHPGLPVQGVISAR